MKHQKNEFVVLAKENQHGYSNVPIVGFYFDKNHAAHLMSGNTKYGCIGWSNISTAKSVCQRQHVSALRNTIYLININHPKLQQALIDIASEGR